MATKKRHAKKTNKQVAAMALVMFDLKHVEWTGQDQEDNVHFVGLSVFGTQKKFAAAPKSSIHGYVKPDGEIVWQV